MPIMPRCAKPQILQAQPILSIVISQCLRDPDFVKAMEAGRSWGFHDGACVFSADVVTKLDSDATRDRNVVVAILKVPAHVSPAEFRGKIDALLDGIHELRKPPAIRSTMVRRVLDMHRESRT